MRQTRWPEQADDTGWDAGTDGAFLRRLAGYWRSGFDWRAQEARLNSLPQFVTELDGHRIHFVHQRGAGPAPLPLIVTHGWPGSFAEMQRVIPLLADPGGRGSASRKSRTGRVSTPDKWPRGGHFAAMEAPELLVEEIQALFRTLRS